MITYPTLEDGSRFERFIMISLFIVSGFGSLLGYVAGVLVGGVFLIADVLRKRYSRDIVPEPSEPPSNGTPDTKQLENSPWAT